jgi:hypothetical protein
MARSTKSVRVEIPESAWSPTAAPGSFDSRAVAYIQSMPGGRRFGHPSSPITISALVVLLIILIWVMLSRLGWLP